MFKKNLFANGFTLLELLIVIAIIGIISTITVVNLQNLRAKARDSVRLADMRQIQKAMEVFYAVNERYPNDGSAGSLLCNELPWVVFCQSIGNPDSWIPELTGAPLSSDPLNIGTPDNYFYAMTRNGLVATDSSEYYYLLFNLETLPIIDECNGSPFGAQFSCFGGGKLP